MKILKELMGYVIIIVSIISIRAFIVTPVMVSGNSMYPTLENGELLLLNKVGSTYKRNDIVVINYDNGIVKEKLIKRVIGLPGEKIEYKNGMLYVNDEYVMDPFASTTYDFSTNILGDIIPEDKYLVLGDNRGNSVDSRMIGLIDEDDIEGKTAIRFYPLDKVGKVD